MKVSVYIIAFNEEEKIRECINSVLWADEIILADSYSTDNTPIIAQELGVKVVNIKFSGFGNLRNEAVKNCSNDWILSIDADERCTPEVENEIKSILKAPKSDIYFIPRRNFFMGRWIRYSGWYPNYRQPQLFKKNMMTYDLKPVHEGYISLSSKQIGKLNSSIWQIPFKDFTEVVHKANKYSSLGVQKLKDRGKNSNVLIAFLHGFWAFFKHYFLKLGILDGGPGCVIAFSNFEGTFYRYLKLYEDSQNWEVPKNYKESNK